MLADPDRRIMAILAKDPLISYARLGRLLGVSGTTAAARIRDLVDREVLLPEFVKAQISYTRVGLEPSACFIASEPSKWLVVERALDLHPYTRYRIRCKGPITGHFALFATPYGTLHLLRAFLEGLQGLIGKESDVQLFPVIADPVYRETDFHLLRKDLTWGFDWQDWTVAALAARKPLSPKRPSLLHLLDRKDMRILRELSIDYRKERKEVAERVGIEPYALSKRLRFCREKGILSGHRIAFNRSLVGLLSNVVFLCRCSVHSTEIAANAVGMLPFQSAFLPIEGGFVLHLDQLPPKDFPHVSNLLGKVAGHATSMWCDYSSSWRYFFDNEPTNFGREGWRNDAGFMRDQPLAGARAPMD